MTRRKIQPLALSRERILEGALELIEAGGLPAFSTRKLGAQLGCEAMSIYHHFPSKQHLLDALVEQAIASVDVPAPTEDGAENERRLRLSLASYREMARRWPALFPLVALHRLNMPTGVRFIESILRLMRSVEPDIERAARLFRAIGYYLIGSGLEETAGYARGPSAAEPVGNDLIARECPNLVAAAPYFQERHWERTFWFGIEALLAEPRREPTARARTASRGRR